MLIVGIPKEIKNLERRVGMSPQGVKFLTDGGVRVLVETSAGKASGFSDQDYQTAGASILPSAAELYAKAQLIQKVKEPLPAEYGYFRSGQIIFGFFHLASPEQGPLLKKLVQSEVTAIAYETLRKGRQLPILAPMSEIAGELAAAYALFLWGMGLSTAAETPLPLNLIHHLEKIAKEGLTPVTDLSGVKMLIFGAGVAGLRAHQIGKSYHAQCLVVEKMPDRRDQLKKEGISVFSPEEVTEALLSEVDILIGSAHVIGHRAAVVIYPHVFEKVCEKHKKIVVDISIDQGGNFPNARTTSYDHPIYRDEFGNVRFAVPNLPAFAGKKASEALTDATKEYTLELAKDFQAACQKFPELAGAINVHAGEITLPNLK